MSANINIITQKVELNFNQIENEIFNGDMFSAFRGSFEVKKLYVKKENADIKCDLDIRLKEWPEGVYIKAYKHKALGVLPYIKDDVICQRYLNVKPVPCKFWKDSFYFSHADNLDQDRYVQLDGNTMTGLDTETCLLRIKVYIDEINQIVLKHNDLSKD
jgi:hypothetical protein